MNAVPIVRAQNVKMGRFIENKNEAITKELSEQLPRSALYKDCLLMTFIGAGVGETCIFHANKRNHLAPNVAKIEPFDEHINMEYALSFFMSSLGQLGVTNISKSTAQASLSMATIRELIIPIPPIKEQSRIANEVAKWFSLIECIEENKGNLQETIKQTKSKILDLAIHGKLVPQDPTDEPAYELLKRINPKAEITCDNPHYRKLPKGWVIAHLSNIAEIKNGYAFKSSNYISSNGIRIIRIANVQDGFIEDKTPQYYPKESCDDIENFFLKEKDLLMSLTGNVGRVGLLPKSFLPAALNQRVACIRENELLIDKEYLCYLFQSNEFQRKCIKSAKGVAQLNISTEWLKCYQIPIPPMAEQKRIVETISLLFANLRMIEASL